MEYILDNTLEVKPISDRVKWTPTTKRDRNPDPQKLVRNAVKGTYNHTNYLEYLAMCYNNHRGVVLAPDHLWYMILCELAGHIKDNSEKYRDLFSKSNTKVEIAVPTGDPELIDLNLIAEKLNSLVPLDTNLFLLDFTTSYEGSRLAFKAAFADAMSPYYNYSMFMCGIPKIKILGVVEDWYKIQNTLITLEKVLDLKTYFNNTITTLGHIIGCFDTIFEERNITLLKELFWLERCGSGSQVEVMGWIKSLYIKTPRTKYVGNYSTHVSMVPYTCLDTNRKFELNYGLFGSNEEDGYLVPDFGFYINENISEKKIEKAS